MTDTKSLLNEIEAIIAYDSKSWPLRCSLSSAQINRIAEIVKEIKDSDPKRT